MVRAALLIALVLQAPQTPAFDAARAWEHLQQLVAIGPRPAGSPGIERARAYITRQLRAAGLDVVEQAWEAQTPVDRVRMVNLVATVPGARPERLIVAGHYDTKLSRAFPFVGANDGGSSAAFLIELGRVLARRTNAFTIELLFLDGEEARLWTWQGTDNTYGSRHYVDAARRGGTLRTLKAMVLVDMIADRDLQFKREANSTPWLTDLIWREAGRLGLSAYFRSETTPIEDDHLPFLRAGIPAVNLIDLDYPAWHTPSDTLDAVSPRGLQVVGDVLLAALPRIEERLARSAP